MGPRVSVTMKSVNLLIITSTGSKADAAHRLELTLGSLLRSNERGDEQVPQLVSRSRSCIAAPRDSGGIEEDNRVGKEGDESRG